MIARTLATNLLVLAASLASAQEDGSPSGRPTWRVGFAARNPSPPAVDIGADGEPSGFMVELIREMADTQGVSVRFVPLDHNSDATAAEAFRTSAIDVWLHGRYNLGEPPTNQFGIGPPAIVSPGAVVTRRDRPSVVRLADLRTLRLGCVSGGPTAQWMETSGIPATVTYSSVRNGLAAISSGEVDALVSSLLPAAATIETARLGEELKCQLIQTDGFTRVVAYAYRPGDPALESQLAEAFRKVRDRGVLSDLHERYISRLHRVSSAELLPAQPGEFPRRSLISKLRVGVELDILPDEVADINGEGVLAGYVPDILKETARVYNVPCEFVVDTGPVLRTMLHEGRIDLIAIALVGVPADYRTETTRPYLTLRGALILPKGATPPQSIADLQSLRLAVSRGSPSDLYVRSMRVPNVVAAHGVEDALERLDNGDVDAVVTPSFVASRPVFNPDRHQLAELPAKGYSVDCGMGVADGNYSLLWDLEDALSHLRETGVANRIHDRWLSNISPRTAEPVLSGRLLTWLLAGTFAFIAAAAAWQWSLRRELERRTDLIREAENRFRALFEGSATAILVLKPAGGVITEANEQATELLSRSRSELINTRVAEILPGTADLLAIADATGKSEVFGLSVTDPAGAQRWLNVGCSSIAMAGERLLLLICQDVTTKTQSERSEREVERRMRESQQLESIGRLAGGVAHDFNNLLLAIVGNVTLARGCGTERSPQLTAYLDTITLAASSGSELTRQLLAYAGKTAATLESCDLSQVVASVQRVMDVVVSGRCRLVTELARELPPVLADRSQMSQLIMNLLTNAAEATNDPRKSVVIRTSMAAPERGSARVLLEVLDHGCGMTDAVKARMFDPFFSTKSSGSGLGLSAARGIINAHSGEICVRTASGEGTRISVCFPSAPAALHQPLALSEPKSIRPTAPHPGRRVLVVDDEPMVLHVTRELLRRSGCEVCSAPRGEEAIDLLRADPGAFDLAMIDLRMPGLGGEGTLSEMRRLRPDLPVIIVSGNVFDAPQGLPAGVSPLAKPFTAAELISAVDRAAPMPASPSSASNS
ncbi:MAG: transporter substrate-binding domain-containing protein [Phycisphaerales bacterium]